MFTPPFDAIALVDGVRFVGLWERTWTNRVHEIGPIRFPGGRVIVADALCTDFATHPAFERRAPTTPGRAFVSVAESQTEEGEDDWVTLAAWVRFSDAPIVHWELAYYEGFEPDDNYDPGFGVDSGTACIVDAEAAAGLDLEADGERLLEAINATRGSKRECVMHPSAPETFFATTSGIGDGFYTSYWGLDADAEPVCLVVNFDLMRVPCWESARFDLPLKRGRLHHDLFERAGASVSVPRLPLFGRPRLRVRGGIPRVRVIEGQDVSWPERTWVGSDVFYPLQARRGELEIAFRFGYRAAEPLD